MNKQEVLNKKLKRINEINAELYDFAEEINVEGVKKLMQYDITKVVTVLMSLLVVESKED